ncbi:hypothetical protein SCUP234_00332 [Seiridium cupressi]
MSSAPRGKAWASEEDWQMHRDIITHHWWVEDKPLKEVQAIMAEEHDFHASDKMYKGRLKTWGLLKNLKSKDADQIMGLAKTGVATGPLVIRGRNMGSKKWQKRLNRVVAPDESTNLVPSRRKSALYTLPLPDHLAPPDTFRLTEAGLHAVRDFTSRQFSTGVWDLSGLPYDFDRDPTDSWSNGTTLATENLVKDRSAPENFAILNKCFDQYTAVVDQATPMLVPCTMNNVISLLRVGPGIADSLLRYSSGLVAIKLGEDHPLSYFLSQMRTLGAVQLPLVARPILNAYFDDIVSNSHPANRWLSAVYPVYAKMMQKWGAVPQQAVIAIFNSTIKGIEKSLADEDNATMDPVHYEQMDRNLHEAKIYFMSYLVDQQEFLDADRIADETGKWLFSGETAKKYPEQHEQWLRIKGRILVGLDKPEEAAEYLKKTYHARRIRLGPKNHRTQRAINELEEHYRSLNDEESANKWHAKFQESFRDDT